MVEVPHVFVGDDAFALQKHMMKPYPQHGLTDDKRIYNYRHSRARRVSENLFGIIANRWRVFRSVLLLSPRAIEDLVLAAIILHNYLRKRTSYSIYCPVGITDNETSEGELIPGHNATTEAKNIRDNFKEYFCNEGAVEWQWNLI
ncbi:uncharacterized protein LOC124435948 [Xenia sp. Carnegie-2017]|uniref:uncharacterized protein LOC124435948 n=1 Tax=Xenia sp. Carnegie-2017 TaxID=2897299 RepID=UPI001F03D028|nr:uncharacterized protein LOC124435948 [Xenia sp. Carnegie-2017]